MLSRESLSNLVFQFSAAPLTPNGWRQALDNLRHEVGAVSSTLEIANLATGEVRMESPFELDQALHDKYLSDAFAVNPRIPAAMEAGVGQFVDDRSVTYDRSSEAYIEWLSQTPTRLFHGTKILSADNEVGFLSNHFPRGWRGDMQEAAEILMSVAPHVINAALTNRILAQSTVSASHISLGHLDGGTPFALLDASGRIMEASQGMDGLLSASPLLAVHARKIVARHARHRAIVARYMGELLALSRLQPVNPVRLAIPGMGRGIILHGSRLNRSDEIFGLFQPSAILFLVDLDAKPRRIKERLVTLFALTEREADIAALIASGLSTEQSAATLNISMHTLRQHLRSAYAKLDVDRLPDLVRVASRLEF